MTAPRWLFTAAVVLIVVAVDQWWRGEVANTRRRARRARARSVTASVTAVLLGGAAVAVELELTR